MAEETKSIIIDVEVDNKDFAKAIGETNTAIKLNREEIKKLTKEGYEQNEKAIAELELANKELSASKRKLIKESQTEANSLNALRLKLAEQVKERNNLNKSSKEGSERFEELQLSIKGLNDQISGFEQAGGDFRRNVGNYPEVLNKAKGATAAFGTAVEDVGQRLSAFLNPITATIAAAGALFAAYVKTGRGSKDLARATDRLSSAFSRLGNAISDVVGDGALDKALRQLQIRFFGLASAVRSDVEVAIKEQIREFELLQLASDAEAKAALDAAEKKRQIRDEERNSIEERRKANDELLFLINEREANQIATAQKRLDLLNVELGFDKDNLEVKTRIKEAELEIRDIQEEASGFRSEQLANDLALSRELSEAEVGLLEARIAQELIQLEDGDERKLELQKQLILARRDLELEAIGEDTRLRSAAIIAAETEILQLYKDQQENITFERIKGIETRKGIQEKAIKLTGDQIKKGAKDVLDQSKKNTQVAIDLANEEKNRKIENAQAIAQGVSQISSNLIKNEKANAIAQIATNAAIGISNAVKAGSGLVFPANLGAIVSGIAAVLSGIGQAKAALSEAGGGAIGGALGFSSSAAVPFTQSISSFNDQNVGSGILSQFSQQSLDQSAQAQITANAISAMPSPVVSVVDINTAQSARSVKLAETTIG